MKIFRWEEVEEEPMNDLLTRRYFSGKQLTLAKISLKKGCFVQAHSHENEQMSMMLTGAIKYVVDGEPIILRAGETLHIPSFSLHSAEALEDSEVLDIFSPTRSDWLEGRDDYMRGGS